MANISNQLVKDTYDYVLQSDLFTGVVYRIGGTIPVNPIFSSGLSIYDSFRYSDGSEQPGYVLTSDGSGNAVWGPVSGASSGSYVTGFTYDGSRNITLSQNRVDVYSSFTITLSGLVSTTGGTINGTLNVQNLNVTSGFTLSGAPDSGYTLTSVNSGGTAEWKKRYYTQDTPPTGVTLFQGDRWYNTSIGVEFVWFVDSDSSQWIEPFDSVNDGAFVNYKTTVITSSAYTATTDYTYWGVNYNGPVNITLPSAVGLDGRFLFIKDEGGYCGAPLKRIRIIPQVGESIDGYNYVDMNINYMSLQIIARGNNWYNI